MMLLMRFCTMRTNFGTSIEALAMFQVGSFWQHLLIELLVLVGLHWHDIGCHTSQFKRVKGSWLAVQHWHQSKGEPDAHVAVFLQKQHAMPTSIAACMIWAKGPTKVGC
jgi:hypothetical protein